MLNADPSLSVAERVDAACDSFEREWRAGRSPRVNEFIDAAPESDRDALRSALLAVEAELNVGRGSGDTSINTESVRTGSHHGPTVQRPAEQSAVPRRIGRFEVRAVLGAGAFGRVYRAFDPSLDREVAVKVPLAESLQTAADRDRFLKEARAAATVSHPNICQIHEVGEHEGQPYIVMAIVPGQSLADAIRGRTEPLPQKQAAIIVRKLALALDAAHKKGVVHRDLKPANVMFDKERKDLVVMDFGLARRAVSADARDTQSGIVMGTPAYMSPEQARGEAKGVGPAGDVFSLGIIMYELLAGVRPFTGSAHEVIGRIILMEPEPPSARRAGINPVLEAACLKALAKDPRQRFGSMKEFAAAVDGYLRQPVSSTAETARAVETIPDAERDDGMSTNTRNLAEVFEEMSVQRKIAKAETAVAVEAAAAKHRTPRWIFAALALLLVGGLTAVAAIVFFTRGDGVKVSIELTDVDLADKSLSFFLDDKPIAAEQLATPMELKPGEYVLTVKRGKDIVKRLLITVTGGRNKGFKVRDITPKEPAPAGTPKKGPGTEPKRQPAEVEFTPLFAGKDLTGWDGLPNTWRLEAGALVGSIPPGRDKHTFLCSAAQYTDFELKFEVRLKNGKGNSGLQVRSAVIDAEGFVVAGPQVEIDAALGGLYGERTTNRWMKQADADTVRRVFKPDDFNSYYVRVVGKRVIIAVNDVPLVFDNFPEMADRGIIAFQLHGQMKTEELTFRNILIRDLSAKPKPNAPKDK